MGSQKQEEGLQIVQFEHADYISINLQREYYPSAQVKEEPLTKEECSRWNNPPYLTTTTVLKL